MKRKLFITVIILVVGLLLSMNVLYTPLPNTTDDTVFNTLNAIEYIAEFSEKEHSVFDTENHEEVRQYLIGKLGEFIGSENVYEYDYDRTLFDTEEELEYDVHNILGVIEGSSETGILVVAHYDSRGHIGRSGELGNSFGAADDGYGIATLLEIARLYGEQNLENSIYILMTDAEETGLYGASMAAQEDFMDHIGFVINIEARGVTGPAYMFETSTDNDKVIDFYKNAELPVTYSLATAVYTVMPNSTDFTEFLAEGKNGLNYAVLDGLYYYHTPFDNYTNIDPSSIEHYGRTIVPLVDEFVNNSEYSDVDYFNGNSDQIFFTVFPNVLITYNELTGTIIHVFLLLVVIGLLVVLFVKDLVNIKKLAYSALALTVVFVGVILLGYVVSNVVAWISKVPFNVTYVRTQIGGIPTLLTLVGITVGLGYLYHKYTTKEGIRNAFIVNGALLNIVLALLSGLALSGASFLFLVPGFTGIVILLLSLFCKRDMVKQIVYGILMVVNLLLIVPILYSLYLALTVGGLLALSMILVFYLVSMIPMFFKQLG
jgi:hypothetical protein